ncbi:hypothetical protein N7523_009203 [Penicillium sp. IBT 18751x]|nr:hypothetical protein N7523_009203 [Penicillium sp. IBT 18751x]
MERVIDLTWRAYEDRTLTELIQINPEPNTESASEYVDEFEDWQEFQAAIPDPDEPVQIPTPLTFHPTHPISATVIEHVPLLPEYPETHEEGFAYIVNIEKARPDELRAVMKSTQYAMGVVHPQGQGNIQHHDPDLKLSTFLRSPTLREFCKQHQCNTLSQIHSSFAKIDKEYIREIYETSEGTFVFCAFAKQLQFIATLDAIKVDMSYKRVKGDINEVIFAIMLTNHSKIITLCRVFTDQENSAGEGIKAIVSDMCPKQILVSKIYPNRPDGSHIERRERLNGLLLCKTERDYYKLLDLIEEHEPDLKFWVRHKRHPVIAAGLCQACSGVSPEFFSRFRPHTNAIEQSHNKSYALGTYDSLLGAVTKSLYLD